MCACACVDAVVVCINFTGLCLLIGCLHGVAEFKFEGVTLETARSMVAMMDVSCKFCFLEIINSYSYIFI